MELVKSRNGKRWLTPAQKLRENMMPVAMVLALLVCGQVVLLAWGILK